VWSARLSSDFSEITYCVLTSPSGSRPTPLSRRAGGIWRRGSGAGRHSRRPQAVRAPSTFCAGLSYWAKDKQDPAFESMPGRGGRRGEEAAVSTATTSYTVGNRVSHKAHLIRSLTLRRAGTEPSNSFVPESKHKNLSPEVPPSHGGVGFFAERQNIELKKRVRPMRVYVGNCMHSECRHCGVRKNLDVGPPPLFNGKIGGICGGSGFCEQWIRLRVDRSKRI